MKKMLTKMTFGLPAALASINLVIPVLLAAFIAIHGVEHAHAAQTELSQKVAAPLKVQATVRSVDATANLLKVRMNKKSVTFAVSPETRITSREGQPINLEAINKRDEVKIAWSDAAGKLVADEISVILPAQYKKNGKGDGQGKGQGQGRDRAQGDDD